MMKRYCLAFLLLVLTTVILLGADSLQKGEVWAASVYWDGGAGTTNWEDAANWSTDTIPTAVDDVLIDDSVNVDLNAGTTVRSLTLGNVDGTTTPTLNFTYDAIGTTSPLTIDGGSVTLHTGSTLTHSAGTSSIVARIDIVVTSGDFTVNTGATVNVDGKGHPQTSGLGFGATGGGAQGGGGAGHAGYGAKSVAGIAGGTSYGDIVNPLLLGSGGGGGNNGGIAGGKGGGSLSLVISGQLVIDGHISANGANGTSGSWGGGGGGSGGSINISAASINLSPTSSITSNGGSGGTGNSGRHGGSAGGGRIKIVYASASTLLGEVSAKGGINTTTLVGDGATGSVVIVDENGHSKLIIKHVSPNQGINVLPSTPLDDTGNHAFDSVEILGGAVFSVNSGLNISSSLYIDTNSALINRTGAVITYNTLLYEGAVFDRGGNMPLVNGSIDLSIPVGATLYADTPRSFVNGFLYGNLTHSSNTTAKSFYIDYEFSNNLTFFDTATVNLVGRGYSASNGTGPGTNGGLSIGAGGGAHAGNGGASAEGAAGGTAYGTHIYPDDLGSGGGLGDNKIANGRSGGGLLILEVGNRLTLNCDINVNGESGWYNSWGGAGGGGGGAVNITTQSIDFPQAISIFAVGGDGGNAGAGSPGGGGGGGYVTINYSQILNPDNLTTDVSGGTAGQTGDVGPGVDGSDGKIYLNQTNQMPEVDPLDIIPTQHGNIYPGNTVIVDTIYSDPDGQANLDQLSFVVQNPSGQDIILSASNSAVELLDQTPTVGSGSTYLSSYSYSIYPDYGDVTQVKIEWQFNTTWDWTRSESIRYGIRATDQSASDTGYVYNTTNYKYENRLNLHGTLLVTNTSTAESMLSGDWVLPGTELTWTGLKVVFEGTTDIYPSNTDFNVKVEDEYGSFWVDGNSSGSNFSLNTTAYEDTDSENIYTVEITDIPTGGSDISNISFTIRTDGNNPEITNFSSTTHPSDTSWYALDTVTVEWVVEDNGSGVAFTHIYVSNQEEETEENILTEGELETELTWTSSELEDGIWYLHLLVEDNVGNRTTGSIKVRIDTSIPDVVKVNGNYDGVWQNIDSGPVISWTKPNSLSGDMFYVTTNGTTPNAINFVYATNQNSYNLPDLGQGEHQIRVVARNGAGTYGFVKSFVVRYDSIPPSRVQNLTTVLQSNNDIVLNWSNPSADFAKVILVRKEYGQSQNVLDGTKIYEGALAAYTDTGLASSRTYFYTLWTYDDVGNQSEQTSTSVTTRDLIPPGVVTQLNAEKVEGGVRVTWRNPPDGDFSKVILSRNNQRIYEGRAQAFNDSGIQEEGTYRYSITAYDNSGNASRTVNIDFVYVIEEPVLTTTTPSPSTTESSKSSISVKQNEKVEIKVPVNKLQLTGEDTDIVERVVMVINEIEYEMTLSEDRRYYVTVVDTPSVAGQYIANTKVIRDGEVFSVYDIDVSVESVEEETSESINMWYIVGGIVLLGGFTGGFVILKRKK